MNQITSNLKSSIKLLKEHKPLVLLSASIDMLFLFVYGFVFSLIFNNKVGVYLLELYNLMIKSPEDIQGSLLSQGLFASLRATPELALVFNRIIIWFLVLTVAVYIIYSVFQGLSWNISYRIIGKKMDFFKFLTQFSLINLFWFIFYIIYQIMAYLFALRTIIAQNINSTPAPSLNFILWLYLLVLAYFMLISYTLIGRYKPIKIIGKSFRLGFKKVKILLPSYLFVLFIFLLINFLLVLSFRISPILMFVIGILTVFPAIAWARVFFNLVVNK